MKEKICSGRFVKWLSGLKICRYFSNHPFFGKFCNYEVIMYIICGVATTVVNYVVYFILPFGADDTGVLLKTVISWIAAVLFAFFVNKIFAFSSPGWDAKTLAREFFPFIAARLLSLGFDAAFMWFFVAVLHCNEPLFKILSNVFVMIANYFASKFIIFKKPKED